MRVLLCVSAMASSLGLGVVQAKTAARPKTHRWHPVTPAQFPIPTFYLTGRGEFRYLRSSPTCTPQARDGGVEEVQLDRQRGDARYAPTTCVTDTMGC